LSTAVAASSDCGFLNAAPLQALGEPVEPAGEREQLLATAEIEADPGRDPAQLSCALSVARGPRVRKIFVVQHGLTTYLRLQNTSERLRFRLCQTD
jgi:hypothetical protein